MNKYFSLVVFAATLPLVSCSDFLDVESEGNVTTENIFSNDQEAIDEVDGLYYLLSNQGDNMYGRTIYYEQAGANDMVWGRNRSWPDIAQNRVSGNESPLREIYNDLYTLISRANSAIYYLNKKESLTDIQSRSLGEAYFMRGFAHLLAAYRYGTGSQGVPFIRYEDYDDLEYSRIPPQLASVTDNYELICEDFDKAEELLPAFESYGDADQGRAHKAAALGYKVKTLAYWACWDSSKWADVITAVNKLENTYGRDLADNFNDNFSDDFSKWWNKEYLFTIPGDGASNRGTEVTGVLFENKGWGMYNGWGYFKPTEDIYQEFLKDGDRDHNVRLKRTILSYGDEFTVFGTQRRFWSTSDNEAGFAIYKYYDAFEHGTDGTPDNNYVNANGDWPTSRVNFPLMRFAEALLFRAEAYLMTGQAVQATNDLNRLRTRAGLSPLTGTATTADLYHERRCELAFEPADHLYDLKRWYHSDDATLKALASEELNNNPKVRNYVERDNPDSSYTLGNYSQYGTDHRSTYQDYMIAFPYPTEVLEESNNNYHQNEGYN